MWMKVWMKKMEDCEDVMTIKNKKRHEQTGDEIN